MLPDKYQQAWKADAAQMRVTFDAELLSKEVQRAQEDFRSMIFRRDLREVSVAAIMIPVWLVMGVAMSLPWSWYLTVPAIVWVAGFILVDRRRHPQQASEPGQPLLFYVTESLRQVEHQVWLLRNVFWWYLLPFTVAIMAFFVHTGWRTSDTWWGAAVFACMLGLFLFVIYGALYCLNQHAVRVLLEPRRQNLVKLAAHLAGESVSEDPDVINRLVSTLSNPDWASGANSQWVANWKRLVPTWRGGLAILILPTLAEKLPPTERGSRRIWRLLVWAGILKDGMAVDDAELLFGPPTTVTETQIEWSFNEAGRPIAPCLSATKSAEGLKEWRFENR